MFKITDMARKRLVTLLAQKNKKFIRIKVTTGGCAGLHCSMDFESKIHEKADKVFKYINDSGEEFTIIIDKKSFVYFAGTEVDYEESITASRFVFKNPRAIRACGCGGSFAI